MGCCSNKTEGIMGSDGQFLENNEFDMKAADPTTSLKSK